jgi:two-component system, NarL family, sensor histidine kinase UhpB
MSIRADVQKVPQSSVPWRVRVVNSLWFGRSVRTQILIVFILINLIAASIAGGVIIFKAGASTRIEIAASMRLAELMVSEAVQLIRQGIPAEQFLKTLPGQLRIVRHVRIRVRDAAGQPVSNRVAERNEPLQQDERADDRAAAPAWFAMLIGPPIERHDVPVVVNGHTIGAVEIVSEPRDEIAEVWENTVALAAIGAVTVLMIVGILYLVLGRVLDPLTALGGGLRGLERRDYKVRLARPKVLEFATIMDRFNALAGALDDARTENLALNRRVITAQDDERRRTALELHDEVGPSLFGLKANAASIAKAASALPEPAARTVAERVRDLTLIIDHLQGINRSILNRLRPMALGHVPLREILGELVRDRARQHPSIAFTSGVETLAHSYDDTVDLTVYRCVQESLTNAIRHASAKTIEVRVADISPIGSAPTHGGARLELTVRDDGFGIAAGQPQGFGLRGMQERVQALGGDFAIETGSGRGTCVRIVIPLPSRQDGPVNSSAELADYASSSP